MYANITDDQRANILKEFDWTIKMNGGDFFHAAASAAKHGLNLSDRQWNSKIGTNAYAAACVIIIMSGRVQLTLVS